MLDHGAVFPPRDEWENLKGAIIMMSRWWRQLIWDDLAVRPEVANFALAVADELQAKGIAKPKLLPGDNGSLAFTWREAKGTRYIFFGDDYIEESILTRRGKRWIEISYVEKAAPHDGR